LDRRIIASLFVLGAGAACALAEAEPDVEYLKIVTGSSTDTVILTRTGDITGELTIPKNITTNVRALFFRSDSTIETGVTEGSYRLDVLPVEGGVLIFNRTGAFQGTFDGSADTLTHVEFTLWRTFDDQSQVGPYAIPIRIGP